jgi:hypothetical protein
MSAADRTDFASPTPLVLELLGWLTARPRTYGETMEAWRTSCPRMPVWEDAVGSALVSVGSNDGGELAVRVTAKGREFLDHHSR